MWYTYTDVAVSDGRLDITFSSTKEQPKISAIEIIGGASGNPLLSVNPITLDFGSSQTSLNFTVSNSGGSTLNWDAYENPDESWITSVSPTSGSLNSGEETTVTVIVDRSGLSDGSYSGNINVTSNGGDQYVMVSMTVSSSPTLSVSPVTLDFGETVVSKTFDVSNTGGGTLAWNATENPDESWITSISPTSGSLTENQSQTVTVEIDRSGLEDGDYSGIISVTSNGGDQDVTVNMTVSSQPGYIRRVNAGGSGYTTGGGDTYDADQEYTTGSWGYVDGNTYSTGDPITNTDDDELYRTEHYGMSAYQFDVPNGDYDIVLHFAEIFLNGRNLRKMSVAIEGQTVLDNLDIYDEVGHDAALWYTYTDIAVTDGRLDITFSSTKEQPKISAIEVIGGASGNPLLSVDPTTLDFGSSQSSLNFTVTNSGGSTLNWDAYENPDETWITSVSPSSGSLNFGEEATVTVTVDRQRIIRRQLQWKYQCYI